MLRSLGIRLFGSFEAYRQWVEKVGRPNPPQLFADEHMKPIIEKWVKQDNLSGIKQT